MAEALASGWFGAITSDLEVALWFLMTGFFGLVAGFAITALEHVGRMPWSVSIGLLLIALIGVGTAPVSGFLLVGVVAVIAIVQSARRNSRRASAAPVPSGEPVETAGPSASERPLHEYRSHPGRTQA
ncbi:hypothetical protein GCM10009750_01330 [Agromyces salentinus]|uniref:Uncharacterized protein n=1 Tax=Agromyces salentinus TaxID=269421 RepID=A0ABN2MDS2_9MICO